MVAYDGFNGAKREVEAPQERVYEHEEECAVNYILKIHGGKIDIMYGISAGAWIVLEAIHSGKIKVCTAIVDGMNMKSSPAWQRGNISNITAAIVYKSVTNPKFAERLQVSHEASWKRKSAHGVTKDTWKRLCAANCGYKIKFDAYHMAQFHVWYGEKGRYDKSFVKTAKKKIGDISDITIKVERNCGHGGVFADPKRLVKALTAAYENTPDYTV